MLARKVLILTKKCYPVFSTWTPHFPPDPAFSTRSRIFHQTPRFPQAGNPYPVPGTTAPRFLPSPSKCSNRPFFSYIDRNVHKVQFFRDCSVEYCAAIRKCELKYSSSVRLGSVIVQSLSRACKLKTKYKLCALRIHPM